MGTLLRQAFDAAGRAASNSRVEVRYCNTACVLADSRRRACRRGPALAALRADASSWRRGHSNRQAAVAASVVRSRKRPLSRAAEAFLREVRLVASELAEKLT